MTLCLLLGRLTMVRKTSVLPLFSRSWHPHSNLPDDPETLSQKYIKGLILDWTRKNRSYISPTPFTVLHGCGQKVRNLAAIFVASRLWRALVSKQHNGNLTLPPWATMFYLRSNSRHFAHPRLIFAGVKYFEIWPLRQCSFETMQRQRILNLKTALEAQMIGPSSF